MTESAQGTPLESAVHDRLPLDARYEGNVARWAEIAGLRVPAEFGAGLEEYACLERSVGLVDAGWRGVLGFRPEKPVSAAASFEEVGAFLEKLVSGPAASLQAGEAVRVALLSAKGRLLSALWLHRPPIEDSEDSFVAVLAEPTRASTLKAFRKYAFLSDIVVEDAREHSSVLGLIGPLSNAVLASVCRGAASIDPGCPPVLVDIAGHRVTLFRSGELGRDSIDLLVPRTGLESVYETLHAAVVAEGGAAVGHDACERWRIESGVTRHGSEYVDEAFPDEVLRNDLLTYDKCYVGQEVVARLRTYGQVRRKVVRIALEGGLDPARDLEVGALVLDGDREVGQVTSLVPESVRPAGHAAGLAMLRRKAWKFCGTPSEPGKGLTLASGVAVRVEAFDAG